MDGRIGKFMISEELLDTLLFKGMYDEFFRNFTILKEERDIYRRTFHYLAKSKYFDKLDIGDNIPYYNVEIKYSDDKKCIDIKTTRSDCDEDII